MRKSHQRLSRAVPTPERACHLSTSCLLGGLLFFLGVAAPASAELINDPYVLNFADGAGAVAVNVPANTGVPVVFDLSYGSWSIAFVDQDLEVDLTIDPMTGTGQLQPAVGVGDLDWTPIPGVITGFVRDPQSESVLFDQTVIGVPDSVSASSTSSFAFVNAGEEPTTATWRWAIEVEHVPEPSAFVLGLIGSVSVAFRRRHHRCRKKG